MPNVIEMLTADHRHVEQLFGQFADTGDEETAATVCDELTVHTQIEESIVYPALRRLDGGEDLVAESLREHDEAKQLIAQVRSAAGEELVDLMDELEQSVEHHVSEEESEAFPKLEQLGDEQLDEMGVQAQTIKSQQAA